MHTKTKFVANDGSEWDDSADALRREEMIVETEAAMSILEKTPTDNCNWEGYVQQDPAIVLEVKRSLFTIANREGVLKWWIDGQKEKHGKTDEGLIIGCDPSWFRRMLDGAHRPLNDAYYRLSCIDEQHREWNQPYYTNNPPLNPQKVGGVA